PNIVLIVSDDHAYQAISAYGGNLMQTPNMDRIAGEGVLFRKAYVTNSLCGPSRATLLTGKYSHLNGYKDNAHSHFDAGQDSFAKRLQAGGYQTAWIGKYHLGDQPQGFDYWQILPGQGHYFNPDFLMMDGSHKRVDGYVSNVVEDAAENWLDQREGDKPFCLIIGHKATHRTWMPDTADLGMFDEVTFPLPPNFYDDYQHREAARVQDMTIAHTLRMDYDLKMYPEDTKDGNVLRMISAQRARYKAYYDPIEEDLESRNLNGKALTEWKYQRYMRDYLSTAASLDRNIGRMLDYLEEHGLAENTIVIYMSDQGFYMGEHGWFDKRFMYEESFRTPMMMRYPGVVEPGTVSDDFVMNLDIAPTLLDAAGLPVPDDMQGMSLLPLLTHKKARGRDAMYYHYYENGEHAVSPHFGMQTRRYKLIRFYDKVNSWELYDLEKDPHEMHNVFGEKGYEKIAVRLKAKLVSLIRSYGDKDALDILSR
ncbi:MAG TPA: sulfatase, partial [Anseongella sp.]